MTITRKTAASVKMASLTRHSAFSGKNLVPKSWGKSLLLSLTKLLSSHWIIMIIPVKKMNWLHWLEASILPGTKMAEPMKPFSVQSVLPEWSLTINLPVTLEMNVLTSGSKKFSKHKILKLIPVFWSFLNSFHARNVFPKQISLSLFFHPTAVVTVSSLRKKNIPWIINAVFHLNGSVWKMKNSRKKPVFRVLLSVTRAAFWWLQLL